MYTTTVCDTIVIGAGPGGVYTAQKLEEMFPAHIVIVLEATNNLGGRLFSYENYKDTEDSVKDELGGMRIFPSVHKEVFALLKEANLRTISIPLNDSKSLFNDEGNVVRKADAVYTDKNGAFFGKPIGAIGKAAKKKFAQKHGSQKDAYLSKELQNLSLREYFKKYANASDKEVDIWVKYSGYNLYDDDVQASIYIADGDLYGSELTHHHFVKDGYAHLVQYLANKMCSKIKFDKKVTRVEKLQNKIFKVTCEDGSTYRCKDVICSLTKLQLTEIAGIQQLISEKRWQAIESSKTKPLFKAFLEWGDRWWEKFERQGKTTTSGPCRQIHYYDESDILVYNSAEFAIEWGKIMKENPKAGYRKMFDEIVKIHQPLVDRKIPEPDWEQCTHAFWADGSHKWIKGVNARDCINLVTDGSRDGIWVTGDAWSDAQGWVQGALDTSKVLLKQYSASKGGEDTSIAVKELETGSGSSCCCC